MKRRQAVYVILRNYKAQIQFVHNLEELVYDIYSTSQKITVEYGEHIGHSSLEKLHPGAYLAYDEYFQDLNKELERARSWVNRIDDALKELSDIQREIIKHRYFDKHKKTWYALSAEYDYSLSTLKRIEEDAFNSITVSLFGIDRIMS